MDTVTGGFDLGFPLVFYIITVSLKCIIYDQGVSDRQTDRQTDRWMDSSYNSYNQKHCALSPAVLSNQEQ